MMTDANLNRAPGVSTCVVRPSRFDPALHLPAIAAAGLECIELNCFLGSDDFPWDRPARVRELSRVAADIGVRVHSIHAEGGLGGYRGDRSELLAVDVCRAFADLAAELGAVVVAFHAGLPDAPDRPAAVRQLRASLDALSGHVAGMPCRFGWENEPLGLSTAQHLAWIRDLDPETFCFVLDNGHSHIADTTDGYLDTCGALLGGLHLNDNDGERDLHALPGRGSFCWDGFMPRLAGTGYAGPLMLEIEARERQDELPAVLAEARDAVAMVRGGGPPDG